MNIWELFVGARCSAETKLRYCVHIGSVWVKWYLGEFKISRVSIVTVEKLNSASTIERVLAEEIIQNKKMPSQSWEN